MEPPPLTAQKPKQQVVSPTLQQQYQASHPPAQPNSLLQAPTPPQTKIHSQPHVSKASARVAPTSTEPVEKPWEAIKPVQPCTGSAKHIDLCEPTPPPPPIRTIESKLATAVLSQNEASYQILDEGSPASHQTEPVAHHLLSPCKSSTHQPAYLYHTKGEPVLTEPPRPTYYHQRPVPPGPQPIPHHYRQDGATHSYVCKSELQIPYRARIDNRYSTLGPRSCHHSTKLGGNPQNIYLSTGLGHQSFSYDRIHGYPTIPRVHSLKVPSTIRSVSSPRTEVPPDDIFFYHRPVYQCKSYQQPAHQSSQTDYHVTQLQPYFENGRVQYRYSPYSGSGSLEAPYNDIDPYGTIRVKHFQSYGGRDAGTVAGRPGGKATGYHYLAHSVLPCGNEHSFISRDMPPSHWTNEAAAAAYLTWDPKEAERLRMHFIRRENRARLKIKGPVLSQYDNVGLFTPADISSYETLHLRSKSDPGKNMLAAAESKDGHYIARHVMSDPEVLMFIENDKHVPSSSAGNKLEPISKQSISKKSQSSHSVPATLGLSCPSHQQESSSDETKYDTRDDKLCGNGNRSKHWHGHSSKRNIQPHYEGPGSDHHQNKIKESSGYHSTDDKPSWEQLARCKPERSHSVREVHHYSQSKPNLDRDYAYHKVGTKPVQSHYDNLDDYHPVPQSQVPVQKHGASSSYSAPGLSVSYSNRAYSTALGQGAFIQTDLAMQTPETEICTE